MSKHKILKAYYFCESTETGANTQQFEQLAIVVYTGDLFTGMDFDTMIYLSVENLSCSCKMLILAIDRG